MGPEVEKDELATCDSLTRSLLAACELYGVPADGHPDSGSSPVSSRRLSAESFGSAESGSPQRARLHPSLDTKSTWSVAGTDPLSRLKTLALNRCANTMHLDACNSAVPAELVLRDFSEIEDVLRGPVDEGDFQPPLAEQIVATG